MSDQHSSVEVTGRRLAVLSLAALGVVYGDIGTSPLYAMREAFRSWRALDFERHTARVSAVPLVGAPLTWRRAADPVEGRDDGRGHGGKE